MRWGWLAVSFVTWGCNGVGDSPTSLRIEPETIALDVDLALPTPSVQVHVFATSSDGAETDVTAETTFSLTGAPIGKVTGGTFASDGATGGHATLHASFGQLTADADATANIHERRVVTGTAAGAADAFATAVPTPFDAHVDPADGAVIPAGLGAMVVSFAAADTDDTHQIHLTAPNLDLAIIMPGVAGPRTLPLSMQEWAAVTHTARGGSVELDVASLQSSAPATSHVATGSVDIADLDASALLVSGAIGTAITDGSPNRPAMWRYDMHAGAATQMFQNPAGACVGCHLAVSADGSRIAALLVGPSGPNIINGLVLDSSGAVVSQSGATEPWGTAAFDPNGQLLTSWQGYLSLRDADTGAVLAPVASTETATAQAISPDGTSVAYVTLDAGFGDAASQPIGNALHIRPWSAATASLGAPIELARSPNGVLLPNFSSDGRWVAYGVGTPDTTRLNEVPSSSIAVRADGSGTSVQLTADPLDQLAHFASPVATGTAGGRAPESMVWVAVISNRLVGGSTTAAQQIWLEAFYPDRGVIAPAFHLPGQPDLLQILHGPIALP